MAAAVADYTPAAPATQKIDEGRRAADADARSRRTDILADLGRLPSRKRAAGRCSSALPPRPTTSSRTRERKLQRKGVDLIVANDVSRTDAGFEVDTNAVTLVGARRRRRRAAAVEGGRRRAHSRSRRAAARRRARAGRVDVRDACRAIWPQHLRVSTQELGVDGRQPRSGVAARAAATPSAAGAAPDAPTPRRRRSRPQTRRSPAPTSARRTARWRFDADIGPTARAASCTRSGATQIVFGVGNPERAT